MDGAEGVSAFFTPAATGILLLALFTADFAVALKAQAPGNATAEKLEFDVGSVKQNRTGNTPTSNVPLGIGDIYSPTGGYFSATGFPLLAYVIFAYKISNSQLQYLSPQLPSWAASERFDIQARVAGNPTKDQLRLMMRSLLEDRFKLAIHHETREVPVYALLLTKPGSLGPQLQRHPDSSSCTAELAKPTAQQLSSAPMSTIACGGLTFLTPTIEGRVRFGGRNLTMKFVSESNILMGNLDRPVLDGTGLSGTFDFILEWTPERRGPSPPAADAQPEDSGPTFQQALRDQLGLKLESQKGPIDVMVVDHVERPSEN